MNNSDSKMITLPMFPLGSVIFPESLFTLRVFEPRYLELVKDCIETGGGFGVCLIAKGHEVGGGDERYEFGTVSEILQVTELGGGQLAMNCVGRERFRVFRWLEDSPYPKAVIQMIEVDSSPMVGQKQVDELRPVVLRIADSVFELSGIRQEKALPSSANIIEEIYHLAEHSYLGAYDRYKVLSSETLEARFNLLSELLHDLEEMYTGELKLRKQTD